MRAGGALVWKAPGACERDIGKIRWLMLLLGLLPSLLGEKEVCVQPREPYGVDASTGEQMGSLLGCPTLCVM